MAIVKNTCIRGFARFFKRLKVSKEVILGQSRSKRFLLKTCLCSFKLSPRTGVFFEHIELFPPRSTSNFILIDEKSLPQRYNMEYLIWKERSKMYWEENTIQIFTDDINLTMTIVEVPHLKK